MFGIQTSKYPTECVVRRNPMRQLQELLEPLVFGVAEVFDLNPIICATDDSANGNRNDIKQ